MYILDLNPEIRYNSHTRGRSDALLNPISSTQPIAAGMTLEPRSNSSVSLNASPIKRPMPIYERENVFNEWAAVIKHQDEIDKEMNRLRAQKRRERQIKYKEELDNQHYEVVQKRKGALSEELAKEENLRKVQQRVQQEKDMRADRDKMDKLRTMKEDAINSIVERKERLRHDEMLRQFEIDKHNRILQDESKVYSKRRRNQQIQK